MDVPFLVKTFFVALSGVPIALLITIVSLLIALPLGFLLALSRINRIPVISQLARVSVSFVRGTPVIVQIFIIFTSVPLLLAPIFEKYHVKTSISFFFLTWDFYLNTIFL
ncbi:ABC transporter permease subunit [Bacillus sp. ISL-7]|nr:ABC transporter permease subunit [Bacillus sp. ISL-7]